jgi:hypothetical protein
MRNPRLYISTLALAGLSSLALAQQPAQSPSEPSQSAFANPAPTSLQDLQLPQNDADNKTRPAQQGNDRAVRVQSTADAPEIANAELRPVEGELEQKIDSRTAEAGDAVILRTTEQATTADGAEIPKGSKMVGRIVDVTSAEKDSDNAKITIQFEKAELKDGKTLAIKSVLQSVAPGAGDDAAAPPVGTGRSATFSGASAAAGASHFVSDNPMGGSAVVNEAPSETAASHVTPPRNATGGSTTPRVGTVVAQQGNIDIRTTSIPGVMIATDATGQPFSNASGVLLGSRQNVHLDSGTHMVLAIANLGSSETSAKSVSGNRPKPVHRSKSSR